MLMRKMWLTTLEKTLYILLIFCLGGVSSLTYFDAYLPGHEHGMHPYHLSLFEQVHHHSPLPAPLEVVKPAIERWVVSTLYGPIPVLSTPQAQAPGVAHFFNSGLSLGFLLTKDLAGLIDDPPLLGWVGQLTLSAQSATVLPPDKPPPFVR